MQTKIIVKIDENGVVMHITTDNLKIEHSGECEVKRASHVEPWSCLSMDAQNMWIKDHPYYNEKLIEKDKWFVDLRPLGGPVVGPYVNRLAALDFEQQWIEKNRLNITKTMESHL